VVAEVAKTFGPLWLAVEVLVLREYRWALGEIKNAAERLVKNGMPKLLASSALDTLPPQNIKKSEILSRRQ
jgi:hypothetical protein